MIADLERILKGPPGLQWHEETSRWRRPEEMIDEDLTGGQLQPQSEKPQSPQPKAMSVEEVAQKAQEALPASLVELEKLFPMAEIVGRAKTAHSIKTKGAKKFGYSFEPERLTDLVGMRMHVTSLEEVYDVVDTLRNNFPMVAERDYNKRPLDYYRAFHFLTTMNGVGTEIQIRLPEQTRLADWSHNSVYKSDGHTPPEVLESGKNYARQMGAYYNGLIKIMPDCPSEVERYFSCLT